MTQSSSDTLVSNDSRLTLHAMMSRSCRKQIDNYKKQGPKKEDAPALNDFLKLNQRYLGTLKEAEALKLVNTEKSCSLKHEFEKNIDELKYMKTLIKQ